MFGLHSAWAAYTAVSLWQRKHLCLWLGAALKLIREIDVTSNHSSLNSDAAQN
jgi:hypothetical protein